MARHIAPLLFLSLSWTLNAEPIFVDYEGEVGSLHTEEGSPAIDDFHVGQRIKGQMIIRTEAAGPDIAPQRGFGQYFNQGTDFVLGELTSLPGSSAWDSVHVQSFGPRPERYYQIFDRSVIDLDNENRFQILIDHIPNQIGDDDIWQAFTAEPKKDGSRIWAALRRIRNGATSVVQFLFDKVSVTPQSCRASK
jgi:hypothetical protein